MSAEFETITIEDLIMEVDPEYFKEVEEELALGIPLKGIDKKTERPNFEEGN